MSSLTSVEEQELDILVCGLVCNALSQTEEERAKALMLRGILNGRESAEPKAFVGLSPRIAPQ